MPPLHLRQEFPTLKDFKEALHAWAIEAHFEPRILKSDTGRVRVGCKRDPNCPFVIRCNWERKHGREPLARVTVFRDRHTCINGLEWRGTPVGVAVGQHGALPMGTGGMGNGGGGMLGAGVNGNGVGNSALEIRQDEDGNIVGGARVLGPLNPRIGNNEGQGGINGGNVSNGSGAGMVVPVLPKVQRNSASRLPFLMEILPRLMNITKDTTPVEIRACMLREYGAEVHLQQCRRAKTEILKKMDGGEGDVDESMGVGISDSMDTSGGQQQQQQIQQQQLPTQQVQLQQVQQHQQHQQQLSGSNNQDLRTQSAQNNMDGLNNIPNGSDTTDTVSAHQLFDMNPTPNQSPHPFQLHATTGIVSPAVQKRSAAALNAVSEPPIRCPYCVNLRWMKSIKDAVEHMSMHVVVV